MSCTDERAAGCDGGSQALLRSLIRGIRAGSDKTVMNVRKACANGFSSSCRNDSSSRRATREDFRALNVVREVGGKQQDVIEGVAGDRGGRPEGGIFLDRERT